MILFFSFFLLIGFVQGQNKGTILIITNNDATIVVDGDEIGKTTANSPTKFEITEGEHYLQAKCIINGKIIEENKILEIISNQQKVIKFDFEQTNSINKEQSHSEGINSNEITVANLNFYAPVLEDEIYYYAFAPGDEIIVDIEITEKRGNLNIEISEYPNTVKYTANNFREKKDIRLKVNKKSIYRFSVSATALIMKDCKMTIKRIPNSQETNNFNTNVRLKEQVDTIYSTQVNQVLVNRDTIYQELINRKFRVHSQSNLDNTFKTFVDLKIPKDTQYWIYWLGVDQESVQEMKKLAESVSELSSFVPNPIAAFGLGLITELPMLNTTATINYRFMDLDNKNIFINSDQYSYYTFKEGNNVTSDYAKIEMNNTPNNGNLYMCYWNESDFNGRDITLQVGVFKFKDTYTTKTVKFPTEIEITKIPIFDE